ncbi:PaaX family transcriptional regulator [Nocardioides sp. Iso805N]|uniref:PaaX family transcriptional regulator n=1 Tax=Nocardioides sp. Iso805N TaxID=1283287 RepID=UPI00035C6D38|nr:PaaX family transcriptional regulator C-terminal domain-containing protein [Nocardioides sp. Iso805N]
MTRALRDRPAPGVDPVGSPDLPRLRAGASSQHLLTTLLGDYWSPRDDLLPSAALVALLGEFDVGPTAARAALNRLARRGVLVSTRLGRNSFYGFAPGASDMLLAGAHRFVSFGMGTQGWDGRWTIALFSLNESGRDQRYSLHSRLRWLGFAPLYDGTWVSPRSVADEVLERFQELGVGDVTVFRADEMPDSSRRPISAWDLDETARTYTDFVATYRPLRDAVRRGSVGANQALLDRTRIMDTWRSFPGIDPDLPANLLPAGWPRRRAHEIFVEVYDALGPLAALRVRQIVGRHSDDASAMVEWHTADELLALGRGAIERREPGSTPHAAERGEDR